MIIQRINNYNKNDEIKNKKGEKKNRWKKIKKNNKTIVDIKNI